ncbi:c-type cytochrome [Terrimonas sp. NA20]|uniref:C-type cytochrome n=1 Tax=Terrimonas ginsenosidimutans TaxID=2908004 RepID=A0ABS9KM48_9BACT|nr:cytochrome c peroxidase [Terrimonas ginsenosidimutans]MCG2613396.1 c-type cytochrome [Terrimonas ginsenosidimutans]
MRATIIILSLAVLVMLGAFSIQAFVTKENLIGTPVKQIIPDGFPSPVYKFQDNPLTKEGIALGRKLFYEGQLSRDGITSCASCHQQFAAFSDFEHPLSHGFNNAFTIRNAPPLFNLAWHKELHLDGAINHIEVQPLAPLLDTNEMATTIDSILYKLNADPQYRSMFKAAFGDTKINSQRILRALAQFTGTIVSASSRYDRVKKGKDRFNDFEQRGYELFQLHCNSCHAEPFFTDFSYRNIGLPLDPTINDYGRMRITGLPADSLKFKVPSLRNIARTAPYFHDGRTWGLSIATNHFSMATPDPNTDTLIINSKPLDKAQIQYITYFLRTLTDSVLIKNPSLSDPAFKPYEHIR